MTMVREIDARSTATMFTQMKLHAGTVNLICGLGGSIDVVAASFLVTLGLAISEDGDGFSELVLIVPQSAPTSISKQEIFLAIQEQIRVQIKKITEFEEKNHLRTLELMVIHKTKIHFVDPKQEDVVEAILLKLSEKSAVVVMSPELIFNNALGDASSAQTQSADSWIYECIRFGKAVHDKVIQTDSVIIFCADPYPTSEPAYKSILSDDNNVNYLWLRPKVADIFLGKLDEWVKRAEAESLSSILAEQEKLNILYLDRIIIQVATLTHFGRIDDAFALLHPHLREVREHADTFGLLISISHMLQSNMHAEAKELISTLAARPTDADESLLAFKYATSLGATEEINIFSRRIQPSDESFELLMKSSLLAYLHENDYSGLLAALSLFSSTHNTDPSWRFYEFLARSLVNIESHPYQGIIDEVKTKHPSYLIDAIFLLTKHAYAQGMFASAAQLLTENYISGFLDKSMHVEFVVELIKKLSLHEPPPDKIKTPAEEPHAYQKLNPITHGDAHEYISILFVWLVSHLSKHPSNVPLRNSLEALMRFELSNTESIAHLMNFLAKNYHPMLDEDYSRFDCAITSSESHEINEEELAKILNKFMEQHEGKRIVIGVGDLSLDGIDKDVFQIRKQMLQGLEFVAGNSIAADSDVGGLQFLVHLIALLSRKLGDELGELQVFSIAAAGLANSRQHQTARDLAEHALALLRFEPGNDSKVRIRCAWLQYAKIMHRVGNLHEAIVAVCCAVSIDIKIPLDLLIDEAILLSRIFRDVNLIPIALNHLIDIRSLLEERGSNELMEHYLFREEANIAIKLLESKIEVIDDTVREFARKLLQASAFARRHTVDLLPICVALSQVKNWWIDSSAEPTDRALAADIDRELDECSSLMGEPNLSRLKVYRLTNLTIHTLEGLCKQLEVTRYATDLGADMIHIEKLVRMFLTRQSSLTPHETFFLIDLLADHALSIPADTSIDFHALNESIYGALNTKTLTDSLNSLDTKNVLGYLSAQKQQHIDRVISSVDLAKDFIEQLLRYDAVLVGLGFDSRNRLALASVSSNGASAEYQNSFKYDVFQSWRKEYPFKYHDMDLRDPRGDYEIEKTLSGIEVMAEIPHEKRVIVVLDRELQRIPPSLLAIAGHPIGYTNPSAGVPSLAWLRSVIKSPRNHTGRLRGWIPLEGTYEMFGALRALHDNVFPYLEKFGFLNTDEALMPDNLKDCDIVVLGSHGRLGQRESLFRIIANEGTGRLSPSEFSKGLSDSGIVVLFVCSGGRQDPHPFSATTLGLPRMLLANGCRTVVASSWPLDVSIPTKWIGPFLTALFAGENVMDACYQANAAVRKFISHPAAFLAMNVYGDPFVKISGSPGAGFVPQR